MKLRNASIIISLLFIAELIYFIIHRGGMSLLKEPFSALGNIEGNYGLFLFGTGALFLFFSIIIYHMHKVTKTKTGWEVYGFFVCGIITLLVHYNREAMLSRIIHTIMGVMDALILISIIVKFNKNYFPKKKSLKTFSTAIPWIMLGGTLLLFLLIGLNSFMEIFYAALLVLWINVVNFNIEKEVSGSKDVTIN